MTIRELLRQSFYYARTCKSLWVFGLVVALASGGSGGGSGGRNGGAQGGALSVGLGVFGFSGTFTVLVVLALIAAALVVLVMRFVSEGALIDGIVQARRGAPLSTGGGFRAGLAHWGVLLRIALLYGALTIGSLAVLIVPCVVAVRAFGAAAGIVFGIPAVLVAIPWLLTLYLVQAFAGRIAVLENRQAIDAMKKARLFLHGRLRAALNVLVASLVASAGVVAVVVAIVVPAAIAFVRVPMLRSFPIILIAALAVTPLLAVVAAVFGTLRSSIWTIGYLAQSES